jgi:uncharacterized protein YjiS (DUF1127 family)
MSAVDTVRHLQHDWADGARQVWSRFQAWRQAERARKQALRNLAYMTQRDFADIGITRSQLEFHLNHGRLP